VSEISFVYMVVPVIAGPQQTKEMNHAAAIPQARKQSQTHFLSDLLIESENQLVFIEFLV